MNDNEKRLWREIKRAKKKRGVHQRRNYFKRALLDHPDEAHWDEFEITKNSTIDMNGKFIEREKKDEPEMD